MPIVTVDTYPEILEYLNKFDELTVDFETTGLHMFNGDRICGTAIEAMGKTFYFPFRHGEGENLPIELMRPLVQILNCKEWLGWNTKFDVKMHLMEEGAKYPPLVRDVQIAAHLMNENEPSMGLKEVGRRYISPNAKDQQEDLVEELRSRGLGKGKMWLLPASMVADYAEQDVRLTRQLRDFYIPHLLSWQLYTLWEEYNRYIQVITDMEMRGLLMDQDMIHFSIQECKEEAARCNAEIEAIIGYKINVNSSQQVQRLLKLPSSAAELLEVLDPAEYPMVQHILDERRWGKASSTYYKQFLNFQDSAGILHPNLNLCGTVTGRPSCSEPNLLAIPRKDEEEEFHPKKYVKRTFIAREGYWLVQADYKQAEIYLGAQYAGAIRLIEMLRAGVDVHRETANLLNLPRAVAKRLNFSMQYGIGAKALAHDLWKFTKVRYTESQAYSFINEYGKIHPEMKALYKRAETMAMQKGYIRYLSGRCRHYNGQEYRTVYAKASPYHKASSNLIQGGVAEIERMALQRTHQLKSEDVHQLLQIYDSIIYEVPIGRYDLLREIEHMMTDFDVAKMIEAEHENVPFKVDIEIGDRWYDLKKPEKEKANA